MVRSLFGILALFVTCAAVSNAQPQENAQFRGFAAETRHLLDPLHTDAPRGNAGIFVGVNEFEDAALSQLSFAVHDAVELAHLFVIELKLIPAENCWVLLSGDVSQNPAAAEVKQHAAELRRAGANFLRAQRTPIFTAFLAATKKADVESNLFVCSVSSHGFDYEGTPYVMPRDGIRALLNDTAVSLKTIERNMKASKAGHRLLLVDACNERVSAKGESQLGAATTNAFAEAFRSASGQATLASCAPGEFSFEHQSLGGCGHGVFTHAFLDALRGGAPADENGIVRLGKVSEYVAASVSRWTTENSPTAQTPFMQSPVKTRLLPLATRADDVNTLINQIQRQTVGPLFTEEIKNSLILCLRTADRNAVNDRRLIEDCRSFVSKRLDVRHFVPSVKENQLYRHISGHSSSETMVRREGKAYPPTLTNYLGMEFRLIAAGSFLMGSASDEEGHHTNEAPQHRVEITKPYYMGVAEVTQKQWQAVMGTKPWFEKPNVKDGERYPATFISYEGAQSFVAKLSQNCPLHRTYRLPSEAEFEFACRGGSNARFHFGGSSDKLSEYAWWGASFDGNCQNEEYAHEVAQKESNAFGLHDIAGNVSEWCQDFYDAEYYRTSPAKDPMGPDNGFYRVVRGGSWCDQENNFRSSFRSSSHPQNANHSIGFRVVVNPE